MKIAKTTLDGVFLLTPDVFEDHRGKYVEIYNKLDISCKSLDGIPDLDFIQDDVSFSKKDVLRGIHGDQTTWKLVTCLYGSFYLVVVNCDTESKDFGKWTGLTLSDRTYQQVLIPPKFGNGHLVLSDETIFHYKQTTYYNRDGQFTYRWDDPRFQIWWPIKDPILSRRDTRGD